LLRSLLLNLSSALPSSLRPPRSAPTPQKLSLLVSYGIISSVYNLAQESSLTAISSASPVESSLSFRSGCCVNLCQSVSSICAIHQKLRFQLMDRDLLSEYSRLSNPNGPRNVDGVLRKMHHLDCRNKGGSFPLGQVGAFGTGQEHGCKLLRNHLPERVYFE